MVNSKNSSSRSGSFEFIVLILAPLLYIFSIISPSLISLGLKETFNKKANHGEGTLYASILSRVNFQLAYSYAKEIQARGAIPYGPFVINGTNCSRFVASTIINSSPSFITKLRLKYPYCIIPSPKRNVSTCNRNYYVVDNKSCMKINRNILTGYFKGIERL